MTARNGEPPLGQAGSPMRRSPARQVTDPQDEDVRGANESAVEYLLGNCTFLHLSRKAKPSSAFLLRLPLRIKRVLESNRRRPRQTCTVLPPFWNADWP